MIFKMQKKREYVDNIEGKLKILNYDIRGEMSTVQTWRSLILKGMLGM